MGTVGVTSAAQLSAAIENLNVVIGDMLQGPGAELLIWLTEIAKSTGEFFKAVDEGFRTSFADALVQQIKEINADILDGTTAWEQFFGAPTNKELSQELLAITKQLKDLGFEADGTKIKIDKVITTESGSDDPVIVAEKTSKKRGRKSRFEKDFADFGKTVIPTLDELIEKFVELDTKNTEALAGLVEIANEATLSWEDVNKKLDETTDFTAEWNEGMTQVQLTLLTINQVLGITGEKMSGLSKVLRFLLVGLNIAQSIGSIINPAAGLGGLFKSTSVTKAVGSDLVTVTSNTLATRKGLGVTGF
jgi:hypothetical protein